MQPIHELLDRIRWDAEFSKGEFEIGYFDRVEKRIIRAAFDKVTFDADDRYSFNLIDSEQIVHSIPLHRIKQVFKDGEMIWSRETRE